MMACARASCIASARRRAAAAARRTSDAIYTAIKHDFSSHLPGCRTIGKGLSLLYYKNVRDRINELFGRTLLIVGGEGAEPSPAEYHHTVWPTCRPSRYPWRLFRSMARSPPRSRAPYQTI